MKVTVIEIKNLSLKEYLTLFEKYDNWSLRNWCMENSVNNWN